MVDALTVVTLGLPSAARDAVAVALSGRQAVAEATLVVAADPADPRIAAEIAAIRAQRPGDRVVLVVETRRETGGALAVDHPADAVIRLHPGCSRRQWETTLAAGRVAGILTGLGILARPVVPPRRPVLGMLIGRLTGRDASAGPGLAAG